MLGLAGVGSAFILYQLKSHYRDDEFLTECLS
jgi:hypothetical protein